MADEIGRNIEEDSKAKKNKLTTNRVGREDMLQRKKLTKEEILQKRKGMRMRRKIDI